MHKVSEATYRIRPGRASDIPAANRIYMASFANERLFDRMFPDRQSGGAAYPTWCYRKTQSRYWDPNMILTVVENNHGRLVAISWWRLSTESLTFSERYLSIRVWLCPFVNAYMAVRNYLFPLPNSDPHTVDVFSRTFSIVEPQILNTLERRRAWYLSILGVDPALQGRGLGDMLLQDGLRKADARGEKSWLVGLSGLATYYCKYGFVEVGRANVGELKDWDGGAIMFRDEKPSEE